MFKKFLKIFLVISGVVLIGVIVWAVLYFEDYDLFYRSQVIQNRIKGYPKELNI